MNSSRIPLFLSTLLLLLVLQSCQEPESRIIGIWSLESREVTLYENGEISATATYFFNDDDDRILWEFQSHVMLAYEENDLELELEQTYGWEILGDEDLLLTEDDSEDVTSLEILTLTGKQLIVQIEDYRTDGSALTGDKYVYTFNRVEE